MSRNCAYIIIVLFIGAYFMSFTFICSKDAEKRSINHYVCTEYQNNACISINNIVLIYREYVLNILYIQSINNVACSVNQTDIT